MKSPPEVGGSLVTWKVCATVLFQTESSSQDARQRGEISDSEDDVDPEDFKAFMMSPHIDPVLRDWWVKTGRQVSELLSELSGL